eukprot:gene14639-biopygen5789
MLHVVKNATGQQARELHARLLAAMMQSTERNKGLTDGISGDRFHASINGAWAAAATAMAGIGSEPEPERNGETGKPETPCHGCIHIASAIPPALRLRLAEGAEECPVAAVAGVCSGELLCGNLGGRVHIA